MNMAGPLRTDEPRADHSWLPPITIDLGSKGSFETGMRKIRAAARRAETKAEGPRVELPPGVLAWLERIVR